MWIEVSSELIDLTQIARIHCTEGRMYFTLKNRDCYGVYIGSMKINAEYNRIKSLLLNSTSGNPIGGG